MQIEMPKIELYRVRTFTDKLTDTFNFLREDWRVLLKYFMYMMLPVSIVLALPFNHFFEGYFKLISTIENGLAFSNTELWLYGASAVGTIVIGCFAAILLQAFIFAMIRVYNRRPQRLKDLFYTDFRDDLFFCMKRGFIMVLAGMAIGIVLVIVLGIIGGLFFLVNPKFGAVMMVLGLLLFYAVLIAFVPPLQMVAPVYMLEDEIGVWGAYKKGIRLGFHTWFGVFALLFVISIISSIFQTFTMMPWYLMSMVKMVFTMTGDMDKPFFHSFIYSFFQYLTCVLMCLGYLLSAVLNGVAATMQYGHASEKIDGAGVSKRIDNFDQFDNF